MVQCTVCENEALHVCSECRTMPYCSAECQTIDWLHVGHKHICDGIKRKRGDDGGYGSSAKSNRPFGSSPMRRKLPPRLLALLDNPTFLHSWVAAMSPERLLEYIGNATVGFYGALNDSNYVWYFAYYRFIEPVKLPAKNLLARYDPRVVYKRLLG